MARHKTVQWVGGPFDGNTFKVERSKKTIKVGMTWLDVDLDNEARVLARRREVEWPIERWAWRHFVMWQEIGDD
jgi:hypothetical protein